MVSKLFEMLGTVSSKDDNLKQKFKNTTETGFYVVNISTVYET